VRLGPRFPQRFFARPCLEVAPELLGAYLVRVLPGGVRLVGRVVEVEAYLGDGSDPSSHSHRGVTPRNRAMFGPPGRLYVYRSYGLHTCANVVCEEAGRSAALLFRALEPVEGEERMRAHRGLGPEAPARAVAGGPGRLCQALAIDLRDYGQSLLRGPLELRRPAAGDPALAVARSPRIGIRRAAELPYRFFARESPCVSRARPRRARRLR
jgi:DNA-3-methyladenine glycosylase